MPPLASASVSVGYDAFVLIKFLTFSTARLSDGKITTVSVQ